MNNLKKTTIALAVGLLAISGVAQANNFVFIQSANSIKSSDTRSLQEIAQSGPIDNSSPSDPGEGEGDGNDDIYPITFFDVRFELSILYAEYDSWIDLPQTENYNEITQFLYNNDIGYSVTSDTAILSNVINEGETSSESTALLTLPARVYEPGVGLIEIGNLETNVIYRVFDDETIYLQQSSSSFDYENYTTEISLNTPFMIEYSTSFDPDTGTKHSLFYTIRANYW
jgi:hypothetical protein